jgi:hypothetical protein
VIRGTTFLLPLGREENIGYQSLITRSNGKYDDQRGELVFFLYPFGGGGTNPCASGNSPLTTRLVFRLQTDPATQGGIQNNIGSVGDINQVAALIDVPLTAGLGDRLAAAGQAPGYAGHLELTYVTSKLGVKDVHEHTTSVGTRPCCGGRSPEAPRG